MAEQKAVADKPKDDPANFATSNVPVATPGPLPLGPATLEAQRESFKKAEQVVATQVTDNPLAVSGVEADVQNALQNPEASGPVGTTKEAVQNQAGATKEGLEAQTEVVKQQQAQVAQSPPPQTTTDVAKPGPGPVHLATTVTPTTLPAKQEGDPAKLAEDEGVRVQAGDPAQQHAEEAKAVTSSGPPVPPPTPRKRGRPRKNP